MNLKRNIKIYMTNYLTMDGIKILIYSLILLVSVMSCGQKTEDTVRLIPKGYKGSVLVIFNQENGEPKEYENGKRVYRIPENGVLKTQFEPNYGVQNHQFFYVNKEGNRTEIPFVLVQNKEVLSEIKDDKKIVYAYFENTIGEGFGINDNNEEYSIPPARTFYIGNLKDVDKDYREQLNFTFKHHK